MLVPLSWLKEYVDIDVTPQELEKKLFDDGDKISNIRFFQSAIADGQ